jgi:K+/H+ antiporter YhaU regulatory subunit KhtT
MVADAISRLRASGVTVAADGARLAVTGPALSDKQRAFLAAHKTEILAALDVEDAFEERAAIIHEGYTTAVAADGTPLAEPIFTITVEEAEVMARADVAGHPIVAAALREFPGATIIAIRDHHDRLNDPQNPAAWE